MNKFIEKYKEERESDTDEYTAFGIVASHIAVNGTWNDLQEVYSFYMDDFVDSTSCFFESDEQYSRLTSYERDMKLTGHKQSDFE